jgi:hypothetical protein
VKGGRQLLLATDCEEQWGAENAGPADTAIVGHTFRVSYLEHLSNDDCEVLLAEVELPSGRVTKKDRAIGNASGTTCVSMQPFPGPPAGNGTADHPVLVVHR